MSDIPNLSGKVGLDVTDFKAGIAQLNREIRVVESGFRATAAGLGDWAKSASGLETRIGALNKEIDLQKGKVAALGLEYQRIVKEKGATSRAAQDLEIKLNKETETLNKMEGELSDTDRALSEMAKGSKGAAGGAGDLASKEDQAKTSTGRLKDALDGLKSKLQGLGSDFRNLGDKVLKSLAVGIAAVGAAAAGAVIGIGKLVLSTAAAADNIQESAEKLGITSEQYQEFGFVANQIGTDVDTIGRAFARTTKAMGEAEKGTSPAALAFKTLGINVKDANGNFRDTQAVFSDTIDALGGVQDETQREILAQQLFGKSYQELIPLINLGADGLAKMTDEAHKMGAVMSEEAVNAAAELNDKIAALKAGFKGLVSKIAGAFVPVITKIVDQLQKWFSDPKIQAGIDRIVKGIGAFATVIGNVLDKLLSGDLQGALLQVFPQETVDRIMAFGQAISDVITNVIIPFVTQHAEGIKAAIIAIGAVLAGAGIVSLIASIANPIGLIIAAIGLLAAAWAEDWGGIRTILTGWWDSVGKPIFDALVAFLQTTIPIAVQFLKDAWSNVLLPALQAVWNFLSVTMMPVWKALGDMLGVAIPIIITALKGAWENVLLPALQTIWNFLSTYIIPIFTRVSEGIGGITGAIQTVVGWIQTFTEWLGKIKLPDWLTPGSPTPFEMGLRGIADAMDELNGKTANVNFAPRQLQPAMANAAAPISITIQGIPGKEMDMRRLARYVATEIQRKQL